MTNDPGAPPAVLNWDKKAFLRSCALIALLCVLLCVLVCVLPGSVLGSSLFDVNTSLPDVKTFVADPNTSLPDVNTLL